jgi:4-oxalomesaconate tautomerase
VHADAWRKFEGRTVAYPDAPVDRLVHVEHPTGTFDVAVDLDPAGAVTRVSRSTVVRTARKLFDGLVWPRTGKAAG